MHYLGNWSVNIKGLTILHRALQDTRTNKAIRKTLLDDYENHILSYRSKKNTKKFKVKMFTNVSELYSKYIRSYLKVCIASDILTDSNKSTTTQLKQTETSEILGNYNHFTKLNTKIFTIFQNTNFCLETRLMSNVIFMLLRDQISIYRLYHNHIVEILNRLPSLNAKEASIAFNMYEDFVTLIQVLKTRGR